ncbi:hypothetical protein GOL21_19490 [Sinorhizobium medicae]|nr:hypothetical protein [Sinorhizobium medicae]
MPTIWCAAKAHTVECNVVSQLQVKACNEPHLPAARIGGRFDVEDSHGSTYRQTEPTEVGCRSPTISRSEVPALYLASIFDAFADAAGTKERVQARRPPGTPLVNEELISHRLGAISCTNRLGIDF